MDATSTPNEGTAYLHSRVAALYDSDNSPGPDHEFYRSLADEIGARHIIDVGCGTGSLTVTFAHPERDVTGIDPSAIMLDIARSRPGGGSVGWVHGDARQIVPGVAHYAVMSGNVAQHILGSEWPLTLKRLSDGLTLGGLLAFETRNPAARAWLEWAQPAQERETIEGRISESARIDGPTEGLVTCHFSTTFLDTNETVTETLGLQFRSYAEISHQLHEAGFGDLVVYSDWDRTPFNPSLASPLIVFTARKIAEHRVGQ